MVFCSTLSNFCSFTARAIFSFFIPLDCPDRAFFFWLLQWVNQTPKTMILIAKFMRDLFTFMLSFCLIWLFEEIQKLHEVRINLNMGLPSHWWGIRAQAATTHLFLVICNMRFLTTFCLIRLMSEQSAFHDVVLIIKCVLLSAVFSFSLRFALKLNWNCVKEQIVFCAIIIVISIFATRATLLLSVDNKYAWLTTILIAFYKHSALVSPCDFGIL